MRHSDAESENREICEMRHFGGTNAIDDENVGTQKIIRSAEEGKLSTFRAAPLPILTKGVCGRISGASVPIATVRRGGRD